MSTFAAIDRSYARLRRVLKKIWTDARTELLAKPWDATFAKWDSEAEKRGIDANDVGDEHWSSGKPAADTLYLPNIEKDDVVLELGPGTGRITRHIIPHCREMVLVDYSAKVCSYLKRYLRGKGNYRVYQNETAALPVISSSSIDYAFAHGVFEHLSIDDASLFLEELCRVLKPGRCLSFDFDNLMSDEGLERFLASRSSPSRSKFTFYHPAMMARLAEAAGFVDIQLGTWSEKTRFVLLRCRKPGSPRKPLPPKPWSLDIGMAV